MQNGTVWCPLCQAGVTGAEDLLSHLWERHPMEYERSQQERAEKLVRGVRSERNAKEPASSR